MKPSILDAASHALGVSVVLPTSDAKDDWVHVGTAPVEPQPEFSAAEILAATSTVRGESVELPLTAERPANTRSDFESGHDLQPSLPALLSRPLVIGGKENLPPPDKDVEALVAPVRLVEPVDLVKADPSPRSLIEAPEQLHDAIVAAIGADEDSLPEMPTSCITAGADGMLQPGQMLMSPDSSSKAIMQEDGNFVIYSYEASTSQWCARWATNTCNAHTHEQAYMISLQDDNNLVIYTITGKPVWASNTDRKGVGRARLILGNDAVLVLVDESGEDLWRSDNAVHLRSHSNHPLDAVAASAFKFFGLTI